MKITKERKVYASVCVLAAMFFAADQLFSSKQAGAAQAAPASVVKQVAQVNVIAKTPVNVVAERLRDLAKSENLSVESLVDAFRGASASGGEASVAEGFKGSHALGAVMVSGRGGSAIINDKCVRVGQSIDGYQLESVGNGIATLVNGDDRVELTLPNHTSDNAIADANK